MEDGVTLDIPSFSFLLFWLLLTFITSLDLGPVQMASAQDFTTSGEKSSGGAVSPCSGSAEWLQYGTDLLCDLWVRTFAYVEWLFDCFFSFLLLYRFRQPWGSAPNEGDNQMALLHRRCPVPDKTHFIHSWLATSLRSLAVILSYLPLYYSTIWTSTVATISSDIPSYEAIHGHMPLNPATKIHFADEYTTEVPLCRNAHNTLLVGDTGKERYLRIIMCYSVRPYIRIWPRMRVNEKIRLHTWMW